jgi:hypothetical protein
MQFFYTDALLFSIEKHGPRDEIGGLDEYLK